MHRVDGRARAQASIHMDATSISHRQLPLEEFHLGLHSHANHDERARKLRARHTVLRLEVLLHGTAP